MAHAFLGSNPSPGTIAALAQLVEQHFCKVKVVGPNPTGGSRRVLLTGVGFVVIISLVMAKKVKAVVKLQIEAGKANPAPPVGTALGPHGVAIMDFCNQYNEATRALMGNVIPAVVTIYEDRSFDFILKQPPASEFIKKALGIDKGAKVPNKEKVGKLTKAQVREIAEKKMPDMNAVDIEGAMKIIEGTARNMGVEVEK